jgi:LAS superfamily LD-carboxypeptidase LdcB
VTEEQPKVLAIDEKPPIVPAQPKPTNATPQLRNLTAQDFNDILVGITFENTLDPKIETTITGDTVADRHIYNIAESRGYRFWPQADETKLVEVEPNIRLQPKAKESYQAMAAAAKSEGVILKITSGYRSQTEQNRIFRPRFEALEMAELGGYYKPDDLARGEADDLIYRALALTAPAGYSRHHTGYAVDFADLSPDNNTSVFNGSKAFIWLSKDNYANARKYGFIPSYPAGLQNVGPEPEAWEFMWVGERAI